MINLDIVNVYYEISNDIHKDFTRVHTDDLDIIEPKYLSYYHNCVYFFDTTRLSGNISRSKNNIML